MSNIIYGSKVNSPIFQDAKPKTPVKSASEYEIPAVGRIPMLLGEVMQIVGDCENGELFYRVPNAKDASGKSGPGWRWQTSDGTRICDFIDSDGGFRPVLPERELPRSPELDRHSFKNAQVM